MSIAKVLETDVDRSDTSRVRKAHWTTPTAQFDDCYNSTILASGSIHHFHTNPVG